MAYKNAYDAARRAGIIRRAHGVDLMADRPMIDICREAHIHPDDVAFIRGYTRYLRIREKERKI